MIFCFAYSDKLKIYKLLQLNIVSAVWIKLLRNNYVASYKLLQLYILSAGWIKLLRNNYVASYKLLQLYILSASWIKLLRNNYVASLVTILKFHLILKLPCSCITTSKDIPYSGKFSRTKFFCDFKVKVCEIIFAILIFTILRWLGDWINYWGFYFRDSVYSPRNRENKNPAKNSRYTVLMIRFHAWWMKMLRFNITYCHVKAGPLGYTCKQPTNKLKMRTSQ